jgi:parvulin-like peptidyl-prolyl isomerase
MRGRTWLGGVYGVAGALALFCVVRGAPAQNSGPATSKPVATVNGEVITQGELEAALRQAGQSPVQLTEAQRKQQVHLALSMLIDATLFRQFLKQKAPPVDPAEVKKKMDELEMGLRKQGKTIAEFCRDLNRTEAQVRGDVQMMMQWSALAKPQATDQNLEKYYQEYKDFFDQVQVRASHIFLRVPTGAGESDKAQARARLNELRAKLVANQLDFAQAAKECSQCPTAADGGDLGYFFRKYNPVDEPVARVAFALKPGEISEVIETEYGVHLIKVTDRKPGQASDFTRIKDRVVEEYLADMQQYVLMEQRKTAQVRIDLP